MNLNIRILILFTISFYTVSCLEFADDYSDLNNATDGYRDGGTDSDTDADTDTDTDADTDADTDTDSDADLPLALDTTHGAPEGDAWGGKWCFDCHETGGLNPDLPSDADHIPTPTEPGCATCHGGNGACFPSPADHVFPLTSCMDASPCHAVNANSHGYTDDVDCKACHLAKEGIVDCPSP